MKQFTSEYQPKKHRGKRRSTIMKEWMHTKLNQRLKDDICDKFDGLPIPEKMTFFDAIALNVIHIALDEKQRTSDRLKASEMMIQYTIGKPGNGQPDPHQDPYASITDAELVEELQRLEEFNEQYNDHDEIETIEPAILIGKPADPEGTQPPSRT